MLGGNKPEEKNDQAPAAAPKGEKKPIDPKKIEQQKDGSCQQHYIVGDVVEMVEYESKMDEKTKKESFVAKKEQCKDKFVVKAVSGKEVILEKKDFL